MGWTGWIGRLAKWGLLSFLSFLATVGLTIALTEGARLHPRLSFAITLIAVLGCNFLSLRYFVFSASSGSVRRQLGWFGGLSIVFRAAEWMVFAVSEALSSQDYRVLLVGILVVSSLVKFQVYSRLFASRDRRCGSPREVAGGR